MAEVKPSTSRSEDAAEIVREASCSGADRSTYPRSIPSAIAAESPSFLTWMWIQILTACSGVWGARGGGLSRLKVRGLASGAQPTQEDSESEVLSRIAASKSTWSEVPDRDIHYPIPVSCSSQLSVWEELKESAPDFFRDDWGEHLELGRLIGEGGQAQIFEAKLEGLDEDYVLKVFKLDVGFSLADLKRHWPRSMRKDAEECSESTSGQGRSFGFVFEDATSNIYGYRCFILGATLLKDGRFAFLMQRYWEDLHTLIDLKVENNTHPWEFDFLSQPLFSFRSSIDIISQIAMGMQGLHAIGALHRDLKVANVLIRTPRADPMYCDIDNYICDVADYECTMFVQWDFGGLLKFCKSF